MNIVADALNRIREVNMLSFTEITSNLYDHLQGKYPDDNYFAKDWARVESGTNTTTSSKESFHIANGLLYRNGKVCVLDLHEVEKRIIFECHDAPSTGHPGLHCTLIEIQILLLTSGRKSLRS